MNSTWSTSNLEAYVASSNQKYEVFLNFRGADTRSGFTSHLYSRLVEANIVTYKDDKELPEGGELGPELLQAINESAIAIPIFSERYAQSVWCLKELAEINNRRRSDKMTVKPIFYHVKPSVVRNQTEKFGEYLALHKQRYDNDTIEEWEKALHDIANLRGWEIPSDQYRDESELVKDVTKKMSHALRKAHVEIPEDLVGLGPHVQKILEMLSLETPSVRIIGIHGMGGIGKTTLSKFVYNEILSKFQGSSFLEGARSKSKEDLKKQLESDIRADKTTTAKRFGGKKVLIVVDDVDKITQLEYLIGKRGKQGGLGLGSRIILTTRNKDFLEQVQVDESYELNQMDDFHSLQLFCKHAFQKDNPEEDFATLSKQIVKTTGGLPLALEVIGSSLRHKRNKYDWKIKLDKLRKVPDGKVREILRTSFDDELDDRQKHIFLDIACFFIGWNRGIVLHFWDEGLYPIDSINALEQNSLIKIDDNLLWMHDQLRDLGREIVREGSISKLEEQTRLWDPQEATKVFKNQRGTETIQGICVEANEKSFPRSVETAFAKLSKVRLFWVERDFRNDSDQPSSTTPSNIPYVPRPKKKRKKNISCIFSELRWLSWHEFPYMYIETSNFSLVDLTILDLSNSRFTIDWDGWTQIKMAGNLKVLDLTGCKNLVKTPEFSSHPRLEQLILIACSALVEIDESIGMLEHLVELNLFGCDSLKKLPESIGGLVSLTHLGISFSRIEELPNSIGKLVCLVKLNLKKSKSLKKLPESIGDLESLTHLDISNSEIEELPNSIGKLERLVKLNLSGCDSLKKLPESIGGLKSLTHLNISYSGIEELPNSIGKLVCLVELDLEGSDSLKKLPESIGGLVSLTHLDISHSKIEELPNSIGKLERLVKLNLFGCIFLKKLPESIGGLVSLTHLDMSYSRIEELPNSIGKLVCLVELNLEESKTLNKLPESIGGLVSLTHLLMGDNLILKQGCLKELTTLERWYTEMYGEIEDSEVYYMDDDGDCLPKLPDSIKFLKLPYGMMDAVPDLSNIINLVNFVLVLDGECSGREGTIVDHRWRHARYWAPIESPGPIWIGKLSKAEKLDLAFPWFTTLHPDLGSLSQLTHLRLISCLHLQSIPKLPPNLTSLAFVHCESLETTADLSYLKNLSSLEIRKSPLIKLVGLHSLESLTRIMLEGVMISEVDELPENLVELGISSCENLETLPEMSRYKKLEDFYLSYCDNLVEIHGRLGSVRSFAARSCNSLIKIPDVLNVETLERVSIEKCDKLDNGSPISHSGPILTDNSPKSEYEWSFMRKMLKICGYSQNEE